MQAVPAIWIVWGALFLLFIVAKMYASRMSRDEEDQLVLQDSSQNLKLQQAAIMGRLNKFKPVQLTVTWALGAMTLFVVVFYVHDMISQFK
jgi:hypothetical protein